MKMFVSVKKYTIFVVYKKTKTMKNAYVTKGLIFECEDSAMIIANGSNVTEVTVSDYTECFKTTIEIEVDKPMQIILTVIPIENDIDFYDKAYCFDYGRSISYFRKFDEKEVNIALHNEIKLSWKLEEKICEKIEAAHEDDEDDKED